MKKFRIRLWLVKRLLDSLIGGCLDEFPEFDEISEGVAHLHSAIENDWQGKAVPDCSDVERMKMIVRCGNCFKAGGEYHKVERKTSFCTLCNRAQKGVTYWNCNNEAESAKRWLREHGIKEE